MGIACSLLRCLGRQSRSRLYRHIPRRCQAHRPLFALHALLMARTFEVKAKKTVVYYCNIWWNVQLLINTISQSNCHMMWQWMQWRKVPQVQFEPQNGSVNKTQVTLIVVNLAFAARWAADVIFSKTTDLLRLPHTVVCRVHRQRWRKENISCELELCGGK